MKKIIFGLLIAFVALSFMGCPTTYEEDYEYASATAYYVGDSNDWKHEKMEYDFGTGLCFIEVEVNAGATFKITPAPDWNSGEWNNDNLDESCANAEFLDDPVFEMSKYKTCFADAGKYKISMNVATDKYTIEKL